MTWELMEFVTFEGVYVAWVLDVDVDVEHVVVKIEGPAARGHVMALAVGMGSCDQ